jgi:integrase
MLRREGIIDISLDRMAEHRNLPVGEHVTEYLADLAHGGCNPRHVQTVKCQLNRAISDIGAKRLTDLDPDRVKRHLRALSLRPVKQLRATDKVKRTIGPRTINGVRTVIIAFLNWAVRTARLPINACVHLPKLDETKDIRVKRRALMADELGRLVAASGSRGDFYLVAALTGLRMRELRLITWGCVEFEKSAMLVPASVGKSKRDDRIALHEDVVAVLKRIKPEDAESTDPVFQTEPTTRTFAADLKLAGIAEYDAEGRRVDRHALRTTTGTLLARAEVPIQQARLQMRHAEISTTIRHYTDLGLADQARAVARIPRIVIPTVRLTGTVGPLPTTPNDRQHQCQQTVNEATRAVAKGNDATRNSTEVVKIKSDQQITRVCGSLRTDAKGDEKAGDQDRTGDIQLGKRTT